MDLLLQSNLPDFLPLFKDKDKNKSSLLEQWKILITTEQILSPLLDSYALMQQNSKSGIDFLDSISTLSALDLEHLSDFEFQRKILKSLGLIELNKPLSFYINHLKKYTSQAETTQATPEISKKLMLIEQNPYLAFLRGFVGGDCATQLSFTYPNDPNERIFYIYDEKKQIIKSQPTSPEVRIKIAEKYKEAELIEYFGLTKNKIEQLKFEMNKSRQILLPAHVKKQNSALKCEVLFR